MSNHCFPVVGSVLGSFFFLTTGTWSVIDSGADVVVMVDVAAVVMREMVPAVWM